MATSANRFEHRTNAIDRMGRTVVYEGELLRHPVYTRFLHWMVGIFFFLALLSGFGIYLPWIFRFFTPLFGGGATTRFLHPWFGLGFVFFFALQALNWLQVMSWTPSDTQWMKRIKRYIRTIGLFNAKARNILATCKLLVEHYHGEVPHERAALEALPGVGRKTANVVLNVAFGEPTLAVDTHVFRVANRTGLARASNPRAVEDELLRVIPGEFMQHAHHWLILHGRYVCKARLPDCPHCLIARWCEYPDKTAP